jgi:NAD(P)-dependent dehydrogenase (short-subunit alcohol dehydrogenase family)
VKAKVQSAAILAVLVAFAGVSFAEPHSHHPRKDVPVSTPTLTAEINMNLELQNKTALVTGSTAGIGLAIATSLAREEATVIINGRTKKRVYDAIKQIRSQYSDAKLEPLVADVSESSAVASTIRQFPKVDILINNVGIGELKPFEKISDNDWSKLIETNFMSGVRLSRFYLPLMKKQDWGRIIFISSESGVNIPSNMIHYGVTKTMQIALARGLAETTAGTAVTVNSIVVGPTSTEGVNKFLANLAKKTNVSIAEIETNFFKAERPGSLLQRFAKAEEVANLVLYYSSPLSSGTNGAAIRVDGGVVRSIL